VVVVSDTAMHAMILALMLVLPLSALVARRVPVTRTMMLALVWVAILGIGYAVVTIFT
jgi:aspartyl protease family protein